MNVVDANTDHVPELARMLFEGFREHWPKAWPAMRDAEDEVRAMLAPDRVCRVAIVDGAPAGWIGAIHEYEFAWELHPLVVDEPHRGRGIGRALVEDVERIVTERGALLLRVGTDDEDDMTSLGGVDLFPSPLGHLARLSDRKAHPFGFYARLGFVPIGVVPDANGFGKPDILMAKRVS